VPGFRRLSEVERYRGTLIAVGTATFEAPEGERFERDIVHHPGAVSVVPVLSGPDGTHQVVLVRQYRAAVDQDLLEVVAGKRDVADEPPEATARRELIEEVGLQAGELQLLAEFYNSPGFCDERSFIYLAVDPSPATAEAQGIEEQHMTVHHIDLDEVPGMIARREIIDAKTIIGLTLACQALRFEK